jgi:hypothetical protein
VYAPCSSANHALTPVLTLDGFEFKINELGDVADKGENFSDSVVNQGKSSQEIDQGPGDRLRILRRRLMRQGPKQQYKH